MAEGFKKKKKNSHSPIIMDNMKFQRILKYYSLITEFKKVNFHTLYIEIFQAFCVYILITMT